MTSSLQAAPSPSAAPDDRATTFQPVEGGGEHRSGESLLVAAYSIIWVILMAWLVLLWRRQARINARLDGLEGAIVAASARGPTPAPRPASGEVEAPAAKLGGQPS